MLAAMLLALATAIGAAGAHALKQRLPFERFEILQTAVHYQFFHALGLFGIGLLAQRLAQPLLTVAGWLVFTGVTLFSGSLYAMLAGAPRPFGVLTPAGGLALIAGWCLCALALWRTRTHG